MQQILIKCYFNKRYIFSHNSSMNIDFDSDSAVYSLQLPKRQKSSGEPVSDGESSRVEMDCADLVQIEASLSKGLSRDFEGQLNILENNQRVLCHDIDRVTHANKQLETENAMLKQMVGEYAAECIQLHTQLSSTQMSMHKLEERLMQQEKTSYDGQLLWKISCLSERAQKHNAGFYSPPFYTSREGYKLCGKIYLGGDGAGSGTHLSLYLVVLRGDYDELVAWPFRYRVTFSLMDQSPKKENYIDIFKTDVSSSSYKRPVNEMNAPAGLPLFYPLDLLQSGAGEREFVKDDTLFIKITVENL